MTIAVIAANGRTGQAFVHRAVNAGYKVHAGIHSHNTLASHPNLVVMQCDGTQEDQVRALLNGADVVVSLIGHVRHSPKRVQTETIRNVIKVMQENGSTRLVSLTGTGVRFPGDKVSLRDRFLNALLHIVQPPRVKDGIEHAKLIQASGLEWTILRVLRLQNRTPKPYVLLEHGPTKASVSREEVAVALMQILEQHSFVQQAPMIGRPA
ncbi:MAG TPA: NAD(P)H-binding protein [Candidatus Saccharimonadales bacterium]